MICGSRTSSFHSLASNTRISPLRNSGTTPPVASTVNYEGGATVPNMTIVGLGSQGDVCVFASSVADGFPASQKAHPALIKQPLGLLAKI